jgi:transcriptional regulator with XRE-family HTH domain
LEDESLGSRIRRLRSELGFTIHHFAVALLVTPDTIQKLEDNAFKEVPRRWLLRISALTGYETKELLDGTNLKYYDPGRQFYILNL